MDLRVTGSPTAFDRPYPAVDIIEFFKTRSALVVAAMAALEALPAELARMKAAAAAGERATLDRRSRAIADIVGSAAVGGDNLLVADASCGRPPFVICSVGRDPSGAVNIRTIELDRDTLALTGATDAGTSRPIEALESALRDLTPNTDTKRLEAFDDALEAVLAHVRSSVCRLSIVKARLDLQQSFLTSVMDAEPGSDVVRLDSHLNQTGVRDMALEAGRLLSARSLNIASSNRTTVASLFQSLAVPLEETR
jgi:flagellin